MDPVEKIMEMIKKLEAEGMSPEEARAKGMEMMMQAGGGQPGEHPDMGADMAGNSADEAAGAENTDMPADIKTMMSIAQAKKGMPGAKPGMGGPMINR